MRVEGGCLMDRAIVYRCLSVATADMQRCNLPTRETKRSGTCRLQWRFPTWRPHMKIRRLFPLACALVLAAASAHANAADPRGHYVTASGNLEVGLAPCGDALCG